MKTKWYYSVLPALLVLPFFLAACYTTPLGDDFGRALKAAYFLDFPRGLRDAIHAWSTWSGRYTHHFLVIFFAKATDSRALYASVCWGVYFIYAVSMYGIFYELLERRRNIALLCASICFLTFFSGYPHPFLPITYYLLTDILGLGIGNGLVLIFLWSLFRLWNQSPTPNKLNWFSIVSGVLAIGCYEHAAIATLFLSISAYILSVCSKNTNRDLFFRTLLIVSCAFAFSLLARGNFQRQTKRHVNIEIIVRQIIEMFPLWIKYSFEAFFSIYIAFGVWLALVVSSIKKTMFPSLTGRIWLVLYGLFAWLCMTFGISLIQAVSDTPLSEPSKLTASMTFLSAIFLSALLVYGLHFIFKKCAFNRTALMLATVVMILLCITQPNYKQTVLSLTTGEAAAFASTFDKRKAFLSWSGFTGNPDLNVSTSLVNPFPCKIGEPIPQHFSEWPASKIAETFGVSSVVSSVPSSVNASTAIQEKAVLPIASKVISHNASQVNLKLYKDITTGSNDTFRHYWIMLSSDTILPKQVFVRIILYKQQLRIIPRFLEFALENKFMKNDVPITNSFLFENVGILRTIDTGSWILEDGRSLFAVASPEWGNLIGMYVSFDGETYYPFYKRSAEEE